MTDIEIARNTKLEPITNIDKQNEIEEEYLEPYGKYKAKINENAFFSNNYVHLHTWNNSTCSR